MCIKDLNMWHTLERERAKEGGTHTGGGRKLHPRSTRIHAPSGVIILVAHTTQNTDVNVAMVNGCAHQRRREETRDTKEAGTGNRIYRLLCHSHTI